MPRLPLRIAAFCCLSLVTILASPAAWADCGAPPAPSPKPVSAVGILDVLRDVGEDTAWDQLPEEKKNALAEAAKVRLAWFRSEWSASSLLAKEVALIDCATPAMLESMQRYIGHTFAESSSNFSLDRLQNTALRRALVRLYLVNFAAYRADIAYPPDAIPNLDWDGASVFSSFPLPDAPTFADIRAYADTVLDDLHKIPIESLPLPELRLRDTAVFAARRIRAGSIIAQRGGQDWHLPCQLSGAGASIATAFNADAGLPKVFRDAEDAVAEFNAIYLHNTTLKWLDVGTYAAARDSALCNNGVELEIKRHVQPLLPEAAKAMRMLRRFWLERAGSNLSAFSIYSDSDRAAVWEAFTAEQLVDDRATSLATYAKQVADLRQQHIVAYRKVAATALQAVFPDDSVLSAAQREFTLRTILTLEAFGGFKEQIAQILDQAQSLQDGPAARVWKESLSDRVKYVGGNGELNPSQQAKAEEMFSQVREWLSKRYQDLPQPLGPYLEKVKVTFTDEGGATTDQNGEIFFGLGTSRSLLEYYSLIIHELRHAVRAAARSSDEDPSKVATDDGIAIEGSGVAAEDLLRIMFLRDTLQDEVAIRLYQLDFAIRDARFIATTEATLQRYTQAPCNTATCPNPSSTIERSKSIASQYGLKGPIAETLAVRSHINTQYLQYIFAGEQMKSELAFLTQQVGSDEAVDPFTLFGCGLNTPRRDEDYVAKLKSCLSGARS